MRGAQGRWKGYNSCPTCRAEIGEPCTAMRRVAGERPTGEPPVELVLPHAARTVRKGSGGYGAPLTRRQVDVLVLISEGWDYRGIGERIFCTPDTACGITAKIREKLGAHNNAHLVALAIRDGWIA